MKASARSYNFVSHFRFVCFFPVDTTLPMCQCDNAMNAAGMEAAANVAQLSVHKQQWTLGQGLNWWKWDLTGWMVVCSVWWWPAWSHDPVSTLSMSCPLAGDIWPIIIITHHREIFYKNRASQMIMLVAGLDTQWMVPRVSRAWDGGDPGAWCQVTNCPAHVESQLTINQLQLR